MNDAIASRAEPARLRPQLRLAVQRAVRAPGAPLRPDIVRVMRAALQRDAEITLRFVGEKEGLSLNHAYRHQDHATNVLSFPYETEPVVLGDLVICAPVVEREAQEQGKPLLAHYVHLIVHGVLHLQGHDHLTDADAAQMEQLETNILAGLGFPDPYRDRGNA